MTESTNESAGEQPADRVFADITDDSGIQFRHRTGGETYFVPRSIGSGVALLDYDNDGRLDVYLLQNAGPASGVTNQLYRQNEDGRFDDVSADSGVDVDGYGMGAAAGDVNNDGKVDLLVTEYGGIRLFLNQTDSASPRFADVTRQSELFNPAWATSASFFDYDRDGWLDLVVVNYLDYDASRECTDAGGRPDFCGPQSFAPVVARLFRNLSKPSETNPTGDNVEQVRFEDVTIASGLAAKTGAGLGVLCADFDGDYWLDVFVANDGMPNTLWMNQRDGTFQDEAAYRGLAYNGVGESEADMGIAYGDANADGLFDVFVTHRTTETHTLWTQGSPGVFFDATVGSGILNTAWRSTGFGTAMADFDNDGSLDVALVNGRVLRAAGPPPSTPSDMDPFWRPYAQRDQLLMNEGSGRFRDVSNRNPDLCGTALVSRGLACGDLNNDGRLDVLVSSIDGPARIFQNVCPSGGHWLTVRAFDGSLNRDAFGAEVRVQVGERTWKRVINPSYSFLSSNDPRAHFGLGGFGHYDNLQMIWPDAVVEDFGGGDADRVICVNRGAGKLTSK